VIIPGASRALVPELGPRSISGFQEETHVTGLKPRYSFEVRIARIPDSHALPLYPSAFPYS
jgi:hypothetical protein